MLHAPSPCGRPLLLTQGRDLHSNARVAPHRLNTRAMVQSGGLEHSIASPLASQGQSSPPCGELSRGACRPHLRRVRGNGSALTTRAGDLYGDEKRRPESVSHARSGVRRLMQTTECLEPSSPHRIGRGRNARSQPPDTALRSGRREELRSRAEVDERISSTGFRLNLWRGEQSLLT